ncbi:MAG: substrate-binding domain-containing protein, partial [Pseudomonadota bacterium]
TATVDRVMNNRGGVAASKVAEVLRAVDALQQHAVGPRYASTSGAGLSFDVVLPADAGPSTDYLGEQLGSIGRQRQETVNLHTVPKMDPAALATQLIACSEKESDGLAFQPLDHPLVRDAVGRLAANKIPVLALTSEVSGSLAFDTVATDNRAAGRTAGFMMGRLAREPGKVVVFWGGALYRSHEDREIGFRTILRSEFPDLGVIEIDQGRDDAEGNYRQVSELLDRYDDIIGIYNVGGGNRGIAKALVERDQAGNVVFVGHNLTPVTQSLLIEGTMDLVIHQDMRRVAETAIAALIGQNKGLPAIVEPVPVEIIVRENIMGQAGGYAG